jgi:hypothetical protein
LHPYIVHRAFLVIDEFQEIIKENGYGPAKGELGHDPCVGYGRSTLEPLPLVQVAYLGRSIHVWPATEADKVEAE